MGDQPIARPIPAYETAQTQNKSTQTSTPQVGFEPTISVFERAKTVHASDRAAIVIGMESIQKCKYRYRLKCDAVQNDRTLPTLQSNLLSPSSG
jgi:hypothetical protein